MFPTPPRFLTQEGAQALLRRASGDASGGGKTWLSIESTWTGNLRWVNNQILSSGDARSDDIWLTRTIRGAESAQVRINRLDESTVHAAVRRAERFVELRDEAYAGFAPSLPAEPYVTPHIWSEATYALDADHRAQLLPPLLQPAIAAGLSATGYLQVVAHGRCVEDSDGLLRYHAYTTAQYAVTVRTADQRGSGWAGVDHWDWSTIDAERLSTIALEKCLRSRDPVAAEPGRYTAILEPQAVCDLFEWAVKLMDREAAEAPVQINPYWKKPLLSKIGEQILDERITIGADPMDPDLGFPSFGRNGEVYHAAQWVEHGVLKQLAYSRTYGIQHLGKDTGLPNSGAFRMSGGTTSLDEMIAATERGVYLTRFYGVDVIDPVSLVCSAYTRDGLWLVENGRMTKAIKNFRVVESPLFIGNRVEQLGVPVRVFHPEAPVIVPSLKVNDFNFAQLSDAV